MPMKRCCPSGVRKSTSRRCGSLPSAVAIARKPEDRPEVLQQRSADGLKSAARNFLAGAVQQQDAAVEIGGEQSAAHGMDDVFVERLQVLQFAALHFQFGALPPQALRQQAGKIGDRHEIKQIAENPGLQLPAARNRNLHARQNVVIDQFGESAEQNKTEPRHDECGFARKQNAGDDNRQRIEPDEIAVLRSGQINQAR